MRVVCRSTNPYLARKRLREYAEPVKDPLPFGPAPEVFRLFRDGEGEWVVAGYFEWELPSA